MCPSEKKRREDIYRINKNYDYLQLVCSTDLKEHLYQCNIINLRILEEAELPSTTSNNCIKILLKELIKKIHSSEPSNDLDYYAMFTDCLEQVNQGFIVVQLAKTPIPTKLPMEYGDWDDNFKVRFSDPSIIDALYRTLSRESRSVDDKVRQIKRNMCESEEILSQENEVTRAYINDRVRREQLAELGEIRAENEPIAKTSSESSGRTATQQTDRIAHYLAADCVNFMAGKASVAAAFEVDAACARTLRCCVADIVKGNDNRLSAYIGRLRVQSNGFETLFNVANYMFGFDGDVAPGDDKNSVTINWGRVVALYAFGGYLAMYGRVSNDTNVENMISDYLGFYVSTRLGTWIDEKGGWVRIHLSIASISL